MHRLVAAGTGALADLLIAGRKGAPAAPQPDETPSEDIVAPPSGRDGHGEAAVARIARPARRAVAGDNAGEDDPYAILGVTRSASAREIRAAYLRLVKALHPDGRIPDPDDPEDRNADDQLKRINEAYQKLKGFSGRVKPEKAARQSRSNLRAGSLFLVGMLSSVAPMLAILLFAIYAGWFEPQDTRPKVAVVPNSTRASESTPPAKRAEVRRAAAEAAWIAAEKEGTKAGLQRFIEAYPESEHRPQARLAIAAAEQAEAKVLKELAAKEQAARELATWVAAEKGGRAALLAYIEAYPDGAHSIAARQAVAAIEQADARRRDELAAWTAAEQSGDRAQLRRFLEAYPDGEHSGQARAGLARLAAEAAAIEAELAAWSEADRIGGKIALRQYLAEFPAGSYAADARERIARLEAAEDDRDDDAWTHARRRDSKAAYTGYLTTYPAGRSAREARARLAELERAPVPPPAEPARAPAILPRMPASRSSVSAGEEGPGKSTQRHNDNAIRSIGVITLY